MRSNGVLCVIVIGGVACSSSSPGGSEDARGSGSTDTGSDTGSQGGPSTFGAYDGYFRFIQQAHSKPSFSGALFGTGAADVDCTWTSASANCYAYSCTRIGSGAEPDAGPIAIRGGALGSGSGQTVEPVGIGLYSYELAADEVAFAPGDELSVSATGAAIPAFVQSITEPTCATFAAPFSGDGSSPFTLPSGADIAIAWTGGEAGAVVFADVAGYGSGEVDVETGLYCQWAADAGGGTLPAAALARVSSLPTITSGIAQARVTTFAAGNATVMLAATCQVGATTTFSN